MGKRDQASRLEAVARLLAYRSPKPDLTDDDMLYWAAVMRERLKLGVDKDGFAESERAEVQDCVAWIGRHLGY